MISREIDALYGNITITKDVPSTYEEAESLIGEAGGLLKGWLADTIARNYLPRVYDAVSAEIEPNFPVAVVGQEEKKDGTKTDVKETAIKHVGRYFESLPDDEAKKAFAASFNSTAVSLPLYAKGERGGGGGRVAEWAIEAANQKFAASQQNATADAIETKTSGAVKVARDADGNPTVDSLARGIAALAKWIEQQSKKDAMASLGV